MVEYLGSGMPRILRAYPREAFTFSAHFIRLTMPMSEEVQTKSGVESGVESEMALQIMHLLAASPLSKVEIARAMGKKKPTRYLNDLMKKLLEAGQVVYTLADKPQSRLQQYRLTESGQELPPPRGCERKSLRPENGGSPARPAPIPLRLQGAARMFRYPATEGSVAWREFPVVRLPLSFVPPVGAQKLGVDGDGELPRLQFLDFL